MPVACHLLLACSACCHCMLEPFHLSPVCAGAILPVTCMVQEHLAVTSAPWWSSFSHQHTPVSFRLSPTHTSVLLPVTGTCWCPSACQHHAPVTIFLSPMHSEGIPPVTSACRWPSLSHWCALVACHLSPACTRGLWSDGSACLRPSTYQRHMLVSFCQL